jgi:hypothetical protein
LNVVIALAAGIGLAQALPATAGEFSDRLGVSPSSGEAAVGS